MHAQELVCGISAFAFQGTNAHTVLQRPPSAPATRHLVGTAWQREHLWVTPAPHVMLHGVAAAGTVSGSGGRQRSLIFECWLSSTPRLAFLWDHRVTDKVLFPGAGFFELAMASAKISVGSRTNAALVLGKAAIPAPLSLPDVLPRAPATLLLRCSTVLATGKVEVTSSPAGFKQPHLLASILAITVQPSRAAAVGRTLQPLLCVQELPESLTPMPACFGRVNNSTRDDTSHFHPTALDSCLQLAASADSALKVPVGLEALQLPEPLVEPTLHAASQQHAAARPNEPSIVDYWLSASSTGLAIKGLTMKSVGQQAAPTSLPAEEMLYELVWPVSETTTGSTAVKASSSEAAVMQLRAATSDVALVAAAVAGLQQAQLGAQGGAQLATAGSLVPAAAPDSSRQSGHACMLAGILRTLALEYQGQSFGSLSMDVQAQNLTLQPSHAQLAVLAPGAVPLADVYGLALHAGSARRAALLSSTTRNGIPPFHLMPLPRGAISSLKPQPLYVDSVPPSQVVMAVKAVGINFRCVYSRKLSLLPSWLTDLYIPNMSNSRRDLLNVLGMYPGDPGPPGADSSGIIVQVGRSVTALKPGDAAFGLAAGSLGSHVLTPASTLAPMPSNLSFEEAATTPTVFITVDAAFCHAAAVCPGERVLVHAAAGGVGIAAIQVVNSLGAWTLATAGSPNKRALARALGTRHVLGSRDTAFVSEVAELGGADVVLNSLTSSGMVAGSLASLNIGGRFVEISKRDIWSAARLAQGERVWGGWAVVGCNWLVTLLLCRCLEANLTMSF